MNYHFTWQETQTVRKRGTGCLTSLVIRDMQIEHWEPTASCLLQQGEVFGMRDEPVYLLAGLAFCFQNKMSVASDPSPPALP